MRRRADADAAAGSTVFRTGLSMWALTGRGRHGAQAALIEGSGRGQPRLRSADPARKAHEATPKILRSFGRSLLMASMQGGGSG